MVDEEKVEETTEKPEEEETSEPQEEEETSDEEQETSPEPAVSKEEFEDFKKQQSQFFERYKKTDAKLDELLKRPQKQGAPTSALDPEDMVRTLATFEGLDNAERTRLIQESKLKDVSLEDARKDEDFVLWQQAHKKKVEKEKVTSPSTKQGIDVTSPKARVERFKGGQMTTEEEEKFLVETGIMKDYSRKR